MHAITIAVCGALVLSIACTSPLKSPTSPGTVLGNVPDPTPGPIIPLMLGTTFHGTIRYPEDRPCDPAHWDGRAPCLRFLVTAPAEGTLEAVLTWTGDDRQLDILALGLTRGTSVFYGSGESPTRLEVPVQRDAEYEIRIHSYYSTQDFSLTTTLR